MGDNCETLILVDGDTGEEFSFKVSLVDFERAMTDMTFASQILASHKASLNHGVAVDCLCINTAGNNEETVTPSTSTSFESGDDCQSGKESFRWSDEAIKALAENYREEESSLLSGKWTAKNFWTKMATKLTTLGHNVTGRQCSSKMAGLKNTYKSVKTHNSKSGNDPRHWPYYDLMDTLFGNRPFMQPLSTLDSDKIGKEENLKDEHKGESSRKQQDESPRSAKRSKTNLFGKVLSRLEENAKDRKEFHKEAMKRQDRLIDVLEKLISKE